MTKNGSTPNPNDDERVDAADRADPAALRIDVRGAMGIDVGPWTISPDDPSGATVRWLDGSHAVVALDGSTPVVLGPSAASPSSPRGGAARREVVVGGWRILLDVEPERTAALRDRARRGREDVAHSGPLEVRAVIPGRVVAVSVSEGDAVEAGQTLLVVEAMKMQNELRSPRAGTIERIVVGVGNTVDLGAILVVLR